MADQKTLELIECFVCILVVLTDPSANKFATEVAKIRAHLQPKIGATHATASDAPDTPTRRSAQVQRRLTPEQIERLVARYQAGATVYELAEEFKCNRTTVSKKLKDAGITLRRTPPTEHQIDEMVRLYTSGLSLVRVGEKLGVAAHTVLKYLQVRGVHTRDTHDREQ